MSNDARILPIPRCRPHIRRSTRPSCPICHAVVYSHSGVHPQCAARRFAAAVRAADRSAAARARAMFDETSFHQAADRP